MKPFPSEFGPGCSAPIIKPTLFVLVAFPAIYPFT